MSGGLLTLRADGPLGRTGEAVLVPFDQVMLPFIVRDACWQVEELEFLTARIDALQQYAVLDIGANVGLFTRQVSRRLTNVAQYLCVEADPSNYRALRFNLADLSDDACSTWNVALSDHDGSQAFFRDASNFGNYSMNADAMRGQAFETVTVRTVDTAAWMNAALPRIADLRLLWKSDTQGYDELIISMTPMALWERVDIAIVELWRIEKPAFDRDAFCTRIEQFDNKSIGLHRPASTGDVLEYLDGTDWEHDDLYLWR